MSADTLGTGGLPGNRTLTYSTGKLLVETKGRRQERLFLENLRTWIRSLAGFKKWWANEEEFHPFITNPAGRSQFIDSIHDTPSYSSVSKQEIGTLLDQAIAALHTEPLPPRHEYRHTESDDSACLPADLATRHPDLKRLFAWSAGKIERLPELSLLPLQVLDLRHCRQLVSLPALPATLRTLDLTGCGCLTGLPPQTLPELKRLYVGRCTGMNQQALQTFLESARCTQLEEIEVHENTWLRSLAVLRDFKHLRVIRAHQCPNLAELPDWGGWNQLEHIDLHGDSSLRSLPQLPVMRLQYLALHGCHGISSYLGQGLNERDRGMEPSENSADLFCLRTKLGWSTQKHPRCKLLFLGNGRGGKTTLAKALQWREMDESKRKAHPHLEPVENEDISHAIRQYEWHTRLQIDGRHEDAEIRLWDFGGQETYHGTHRIFAASGAVYVLVAGCRKVPTSDPQRRLSDAEWKMYNRQRPIEYWLDYILDLDRRHGGHRSANARVLLVHSAWAPGSAREFIRNRLSDRHRKLIHQEYFVGSLRDEWNLTDFETAFREDLKSVLAAQVAEEGIDTPDFFVALLDAIAHARNESTSLANNGAILSWESWCSRVRDVGKRAGIPDLDHRDIEAVTRMFHRSGDLFWMHRLDRTVIVNQKAALEEIYKLLDFRNESVAAVRKRIRYFEFGIFDADEIRHSLWHSFSREVQDQLLAFMEECQISARVFPRGGAGVVGERHVALDPALLPPGDLLELETDFRRPIDLAGLKTHQEPPWRLKSRDRVARVFSESCFRRLQAWAVNRLGNTVRVWHNGFYHVEPGATPPVIFRLQWIGDQDNPDSYGGGLQIEFALRANPAGSSPDQHGLRVLAGRLMGPGSPFPLEDWNVDPNFRPLELPEPEADRHDVAISVRGVQKGKAEALVDALTRSRQDLRTFIYTREQNPTMNEVYRKLRQSRVQILWISREYLDPTRDNEYVLHECANAVFTWARTQNLAVDAVHLKDLAEEDDQIVGIIYENTGNIDWRTLGEFRSRLENAFGAMADACLRMLSDLPPDAERVHESKHHAKFLAAKRLAGAFAEYWRSQIERTPLGSWQGMVFPAPKGPEDHAEFDAIAAQILRMASPGEI